MTKSGVVVVHVRTFFSAQEVIWANLSTDTSFATRRWFQDAVIDFDLALRH